MFNWYTEESDRAFKEKYFLPGEDIQSASMRLAKRAGEIYPEIPNLSNKIYNMIANGWIAPSSPVWANFGTTRSLPISCFGQTIQDNLIDILDNVKEAAMLTRMGGGTSGYFGNLRPKNSPISIGGVSNGPVSFMQMFDTTMKVVSQSNVRRGAFAAYLPIDHPDIMDFLQIKDKNSFIQELHFGITIKDSWLKEMIDGDEDKRLIWARVLQSRKEKGEPYIIFYDTINNNKPDVYKDKNLEITHSNLCSEIFLSDSNLKTFVCCLTAMNIETYEEWKNTEAVKYCLYFLDAVMEDFIIRSDNIPGLEKARNFAIEERALGLGATGWHTFLKKNSIPFDSLNARYLTVEIFEKMQKDCITASMELAQLYGEPKLLKGYGRRNSTVMAIAPNVSSGELIGVSNGIEPDRANYYSKEMAWGMVPGKKDKNLQDLLIKKKKNNKAVWESILDQNGSVQHLDFLSDHEKNVFKTFWEIDIYELIRQAGIRQKYIDQGQSLNIFIPPGTSAKEINKIHIHAWKEGVKALYYCKSEHKNIWKDTRVSSCSACSG